jgi:hypothetical protein
MTFTWDPIVGVNLVLCIVILTIGYWGYKISGDKTPFYIGIGFGLFGISHLATLLGLKETLTGALIIIRLLAYLIVLFALYKVAVKR